MTFRWKLTADDPSLLSTYESLSGAWESRIQPSLIDEIRRGKGGVIGTGGRGVVSIRFDHQLDALRETVWPLLRDRKIPASVGVVTGSVENPSATYEPTTTTWAQLTTMNLEGLEIWAHSRTHGDPVPPATLADEISGAKTDLEVRGFRAMGWQQPGGPSTYAAEHLSPEGMGDAAGSLIRTTYGLYESNFAETHMRTLPTGGCFGYGHHTIDASSLTVIKGYVDKAVYLHVGVQLMVHPNAIGTTLSVADFTALLDYLVQLRDAGTIEILTASGLAFADPASSYRLNVVQNGGFEGLTGENKGGWTEVVAGSFGVDSTLPHTGTQFLRVPSTGTRVYGVLPNIAYYALNGHAMMVEGWARTTDVSATAHLRVRTGGAGGGLTILDKYIELTQSNDWTRVRFPLSLPYVIPATVSLVYEVGRSAGGSVDWDDVSIEPT